MRTHTDRILIVENRIRDLENAIAFNLGRPSYLRCYDFPRYVRRLADNRRRLKKLLED